jgi:hypothetical protein
MRRANPADACEDFLSVSRVFRIDTEVSAQEALVTAEVEMIVPSPFAACNSIAAGCSGRCSDLRSGKATPLQQSRESFSVAHRLRIERRSHFRKPTAAAGAAIHPRLEPIEVAVAPGGLGSEAAGASARLLQRAARSRT